MFQPVPHRALRILPFLSSLLLMPCAYGQYSSLPPGEDRPVLGFKLQKELGIALEALRANKPGDARGHLDKVYRSAPNDADANFLLGVYSSQMNDWVNAKGYWEKALALSPNHLNALLSLADALIRERRANEAAHYLQRAVEAEPTAWRPHAVLAGTYLRQSMVDESIREAERALELGHGQAGIVQPLLALALYLHGDRGRGIQVLQAYLEENASETYPIEQLQNLKVLLNSTDGTPSMAVSASLLEPMLPTLSVLPSNWLPPDIDEKVPPVESGATCNMEEVIDKAGSRVQEFVANVDQFTATETVTHISVNKWGFPSRPLKFRFNYVVSIKKNRLGFLNVDEYRDLSYSGAEFPDGVAISGLSALVLIFHPSNVQNFALVCEGLARSRGVPVWQIHFRQRADKPNTIQTYQVGAHGPVYPVALKGRVWISADNFQILRLETGLAAQLPQIRLVADHAAIEFAPVHFRARNLDMWVPQTAEIFYDWRGHRGHRRHSFKNYLLFSVDDEQQIAEPKAKNAKPS